MLSNLWSREPLGVIATIISTIVLLLSATKTVADLREMWQKRATKVRLRLQLSALFHPLLEFGGSFVTITVYNDSDFPITTHGAGIYLKKSNMTYHFYPGPQSLKMGLGVIQEIPTRGNVTIAQEAAGCLPNPKKDSNKNEQVRVQPWVRLSDGKIVKGKSEKLSLRNTVVQNE